MTSHELWKKFLDFFEKRGHIVVPSSSLIPDDQSVLLTTAGMQQFRPYLTGTRDPKKRFGKEDVFSIQKCFRTSDIDEVGDASHLTFFQMVGNFSFGGYFKERAIPLSFEFLTSSDGMSLDPHKIFVTAFKGDEGAPQDAEAIALWHAQFKKVGIEAKIGERIFLYGREKNWWEAGPGPAGPDAEMFYDFGTPHDLKFGPLCHPNCDCGRFVEIGNDVFVQYNKTDGGKYEPLAQRSVDNGRGFERLAMVAQGKKNVFETDQFISYIEMVPRGMGDRRKRIIADHLRASVFLFGDGVRPSNKDAGYVLRRLLRRAFVFERMDNLAPDAFEQIILFIIRDYGSFYAELIREKENIIEGYWEERKKFSRTLDKGIWELERIRADGGHVNGKTAFDLYQTFGLPYEIIKEIGGNAAHSLSRDDFEGELKKHQALSRAGADAKFGGHGLYMKTGEVTIRDESEVERVTRLHTATHLMHAGLRAVLGPEVRQDGSDITVERTRFDFRFPRKVTPEELKKVEEWVNDAIKKDLSVKWEETSYEEALARGALGFFKEKYPPRVKVYTVFDAKSGEVYSKEFCGGPHVECTGIIGHFKITKEESSSAGVRRIRAGVD